jgi:methylmalonyl-CoA mutase N-terminal domain/subunit
MDETYALPTEAAAKLALRTQQIIAEETGVANTVDPLAGSYFIEELTDRMESEANAIICKIDEMGGMVTAVEQGWPQREIARSAYEFQRNLEAGDQVMVGVNRYCEEDEGSKIPLLHIDEEVEKSQIRRLQEFKKGRDSAKHQRTIDEMKRACESDDNLMAAVLAAVKEGATVGEISDAFRDVWGVYTDPGYL